MNERPIDQPELQSQNPMPSKESPQKVDTIPARPHVIHFFSPIHTQSVITLSNLCMSALQQGAKALDIHFSSLGGDLGAGFTAYNFLRSLPIPVRTHNFGNIESVAVIVYLAGEERFVVPHGRFVLHPFHWDFAASAVDHNRMSERSNSLDFDVKRYAAVFKERTDGCELPVDIGKCLGGEALFIDAEAAVTSGIATRNAVPEGTTPFPPTNWWLT